MRIMKYWALEKAVVQRAGKAPLVFPVWRGSDISQEDARQQARQAAEQVVWQVNGGQALNRYSYGERALREAVLSVIRGPGGQDAAVVTRNGYGAQVLNTERVLFADLDFPPEPPAGLIGGLKRLFGGAAPVDPQTPLLQRVQAWAARSPGVGVRVYRTAAGLRLLFTHDLFDPTAAPTIALLNSLGSDALYVRLCQQQGSFRARLTPKPWRIGVRGRPPAFPYQTAKDEALLQRWLSGYERASQGYSTCRLLTTLGDPRPIPEVEAIIQQHDALALQRANLPLA